jgi:hypothetical protein
MTHDWSTNDAVTAAARSLVERDASAGFRARVLERIDVAPRGARWPWLAVPAAAALATMWAVLPATRADLPEVSQPARVAAAPVLGPSLTDIERLRVPVEPAADVTAERTPGVVSDAPSPAEAAWRAAALPLLPAPAPIDAVVSQPAPVTIALLDIEPLAVPRVAITPLGRDRNPREP